MNIGRKIYYDKVTGNVILETSERSGNVVETTEEEDRETYIPLKMRIESSYDVLKLEYGAFAQDFAKCSGYRVNPQTQELMFSYPNPNTDEPQPFIAPLSEQFKKLESRTTATENAVLQLMLGGN